MKHILIIFFLFVSFAAYSQTGSLAQSGYFTRVNDSTAYVTAAATRHTAGYADLWYSNASDLFWVWNGSAYVNWDPSAAGGGGATAAGATGNVQYKSNGGGLQAEAALTYDSATNTLTVPNVTAGSSTSLSDGAAITITGTKHTLTSTQATVTWTLSQAGDYQTTDIILNATTTTWTFPANTLCVYEGVASGDNTAVLSGTSGDHYIMSTYKDGTNYRVVIKNFGQ